LIKRKKNKNAKGERPSIRVGRKPERATKKVTKVFSKRPPGEETGRNKGARVWNPIRKKKIGKGGRRGSNIRHNRYFRDVRHVFSREDKFG